MINSRVVTSHLTIHYTAKRFNSNPNNPGDVTPDPTEPNEGDEGEEKGHSSNSDAKWKSTAWKMLENAAGTGATIAMLA